MGGGAAPNRIFGWVRERAESMGSNERLEVLKNDLVSRLFVDTADYALARIAHRMQMDNGFFWLAGQAVEKLLKASLLLNGHSAARDGHNLVELYRKVTVYASDLLPEKLDQPCWLEFQSGDSWQAETPLAFLERIRVYTDPDTRYNVFGTSLRGEDLIHLDQLIFALRRVAFPLDAFPFFGKPTGKPGSPQTVREMLERFPKYQPRKGPFERLWTASGVGKDLSVYEAVVFLNRSFAPDSEVSGLSFVWDRHQVSPLYTRILGLVGKAKSHSTAEAAELADWAVDNIKLPKEVMAELRKATQKLRGS